MLNITYAVSDVDLAERLQHDLSQNSIRLEKPLLIVLITPDAVEDSSVKTAIAHALNEKHTIVPLMVERAPLPDTIADLKAHTIQRDYDLQRILHIVRRADIGDRVLASNRRILLYLGVVVAIIFGVAVWTLATGIIAPPTDEYATENAIRVQQIETLTFPTLDAYMPRSTQDALAFPQTVEAANTRNAPLLAASATAQPRSLQASATAQQDAVIATSTARAQATRQDESD